MKKTIAVLFTLIIAITLIFLSHDMIKDHMPFQEAIGESLVGGSIGGMIFGGLILYFDKKKKK